MTQQQPIPRFISRLRDIGGISGELPLVILEVGLGEPEREVIQLAFPAPEAEEMARQLAAATNRAAAGVPTARRSSFTWNLDKDGLLLQVDADLDVAELEQIQEQIRDSGTLTLQYLLRPREMAQLMVDLRRGLPPSDRADKR